MYCLNEWGVSGRTVFAASVLSARLEYLPRPVLGAFDYETDGLGIVNFRFMETDGGPVRIYEAPKKTAAYVIGADTAGEGGDNFVAQVLENESGMQVAVMVLKADEDVFAEQLYCLGRYYNDALIGVETNFSTFPVKRLAQLSYPHQYIRERVDTYTNRLSQSYGFRTTSATRPLIIAGLVREVREQAQNLNDRQTIEEMLSFVRNERGRAEAAYGAHDDCVIALAIAQYIRPQQVVRLSTPRLKTEKLIDKLTPEKNGVKTRRKEK